MAAHDVRLPGWDLTVSRGVEQTLRAVDPPDGAGGVVLWVGGDLGDLDAEPEVVVAAVADGGSWTWTVPAVEAETLIRWSVDGESPASLGWLRPSRLGAPSPTVDVALRLDEITLDLTLLGGGSGGGGGSGPPLSDADPEALGVAAPGTGSAASRDDHVHPLPSPADLGAVADDDARLSDARTPTAHSHPWSDITDPPSIPSVPGSIVETVTGAGVDNTDPANPVIAGGGDWVTVSDQTLGTDTASVTVSGLGSYGLIEFLIDGRSSSSSSTLTFLRCLVNGEPAASHVTIMNGREGSSIYLQDLSDAYVGRLPTSNTNSNRRGVISGVAASTAGRPQVLAHWSAQFATTESLSSGTTGATLEVDGPVTSLTFQCSGGSLVGGSRIYVRGKP